MQLLTKEIINKLPPLGSTDGEQEKKIACKFFNPMGAGTWYVVEGEKLSSGDWRFFGLVSILETEWGYFHLKELEAVEVFGLGIERDILFDDRVIDMETRKVTYVGDNK